MGAEGGDISPLFMHLLGWSVDTDLTKLINVRSVRHSFYSSYLNTATQPKSLALSLVTSLHN